MRKDGPHLQEHVDESEHRVSRRENSPEVWVLVSLELTGSLLWQYREYERMRLWPQSLESPVLAGRLRREP